VHGNSNCQIGEILGVENGLVEPSPQAYPPEGTYLARTLVRHRREVSVRVMIDTRRDQKLQVSQSRCRLHPIWNSLRPENWSSKLQDVITAAMPRLSKGEFQVLEEFLTDNETPSL
jgi:hypothetical protein